MKIVNQRVTPLFPLTEDEAMNQLLLVEIAGRNCYRSGDKICAGSHEQFIRSLLSRGHETPLEFATLSFHLVTSRAVMAELTRHRLMSFCIESQRYVNYSSQKNPLDDNFRFIEPDIVDNPDLYGDWKNHMQQCADTYNRMIESGAKAQEARDVLPNATAVNIVCSANLREWRHLFKLRCDKAAYPPMRALAKEMLKHAYYLYPVVFEDLYTTFFPEDAA